MPFSKAFGKDKAKNGAKTESDFNYDKKHRFYIFYKGHDEFEMMPLDSKYFLLNLKLLDQKTQECKSRRSKL